MTFKNLGEVIIYTKPEGSSEIFSIKKDLMKKAMRKKCTLLIQTNLL